MLGIEPALREQGRHLVEKILVERAINQKFLIHAPPQRKFFDPFSQLQGKLSMGTVLELFVDSNGRDMQGYRHQLLMYWLRLGHAPEIHGKSAQYPALGIEDGRRPACS